MCSFMLELSLSVQVFFEDRIYLFALYFVIDFLGLADAPYACSEVVGFRIVEVVFTWHF